VRDAEVKGLAMEATIKVKSEGGKPITFSIDGVGYTATEGMTWLEWLDSEYCPRDENAADVWFDHEPSSHRIIAYWTDWMQVSGYVSNADYSYVNDSDIIAEGGSYIKTQN
jgi:hypothetical protein